MTKPIKFIDLFAGVGGFRIAFESQKAQCVFSSEWDKFSQITYEANFGEKPEGDITLIDSKKIPSHDILTAGFPCQPFSNAGLKKGFEDTRGTLFYDVARIINDKKPSMVLLENVKGFVNHNKGRTLRVVLETLDELGYNTTYKVLNAKDFGVPQNRERIFIVGVNRKKLGKIGFEFPNPLNKRTLLGQILEKNPDIKYTISNKLWQGHKRRLKEHRLKGNGFGYGMFNEESTHTNTISARYYKDGSEILINQGRRNPRMLTPREAARLQGFPEKFTIPVSDTQAYRQFGNSVAVPVVTEIAKKMIDLIENPNKGKPFVGYIQRELEL
jgi:DNA (cytosine-5)-methyltransferase 1